MSIGRAVIDDNIEANPSVPGSACAEQLLMRSADKTEEEALVSSAREEPPTILERVGRSSQGSSIRARQFRIAYATWWL
jgi:hypothetical protein